MSSTAGDDMIKGVMVLGVGIVLGWVIFTPRGQDLAKACAQEGYKKAEQIFRDYGSSPCPYRPTRTRRIGDKGIPITAAGRRKK